MRQCNCPKYNFLLGYWRESKSIASTNNHHNIVDNDKRFQRFWELKEMFPLANRLTAEEAACEQLFIQITELKIEGTLSINQ
jgi:hypothetical protein